MTNSNVRWVVFSSRRQDGRYTRLYLAHFDGEGHFGKPFLLPQKRYEHKVLRLKSYNVRMGRVRNKHQGVFPGGIADTGETEEVVDEFRIVVEIQHGNRVKLSKSRTLGCIPVHPGRRCIVPDKSWSHRNRSRPIRCSKVGLSPWRG